MKRGSALLMALWIILTLSVIVLSFAFEAKLQGGVNLYVEGKNRVKRLIPAGRLMGEIVLLGYRDGSITQQQGDETEADIAEKLEDDRWYLEKRSLKFSHGCTIGPILLDEEDPDSGTVRVEIAMPKGGINVNMLYKGVDPNFEDRWRLILDRAGIPDVEVPDENGGTVNLHSYIIACWQDFRDDDNEVYEIADTTNFKGAKGAEDAEYEEYYEDHRKEIDEEDRFKPAGMEISDLKELSRVICFRKFPALLTGGPLLSEDGDTKTKQAKKRDRKNNNKDEINVRPGLLAAGLLTTKGFDNRLNVNSCTKEQLMTVPGIYDPSEIDEKDKSESELIAEAIVNCRTRKPKDYDVPEDEERQVQGWGYGEFTNDWWSDLTQRIADEYDVELPSEAKEYLTSIPSEESQIFTMTITAELMGMEYQAVCDCYVKDGEVRYLSWEEK